MAQRFHNEIGKTPYSAPKLAIYGEFSQLTASGTGSKVENAGGQATKKP